MVNPIPDELLASDNTAVSNVEQKEFLRQLPEWTVVDDKNIYQLQRIFNFRNFAEAIAFTNHIAELAEQANHHPLIMTEWGRVTVKWWTHRIKGLHLNDFVMASKTNHAYDRLQAEVES